MGGCAGTSATFCHGRHGACHATALIRAPAASLRAFPAMLCLEFGALIGACIADFRASLAYGADHLAAPRHAGDSKAADLCAIHIQLDTARH